MTKLADTNGASCDPAHCSLRRRGRGQRVRNTGTTLMLDDVVVTDKLADDNGGGIFNSGGTLHLTNSSVTDNTASFGAGIYASGPTNLTKSAAIRAPASTVASFSRELTRASSRTARSPPTRPRTGARSSCRTARRSR